MTVSAGVVIYLVWAVASAAGAAASSSPDSVGFENELSSIAASDATAPAAGSSIGVGGTARLVSSHHKHKRQKGGSDDGDDDSGGGGANCAACWPDRFGIVSWVMAAALLLAPIGLSAWLGLKLHKRIVLAMARFAARLLLTGVLLLPIMAYNHALLTGLYMVMATAIGAAEAASHCDYLYQGEFLHLLVALGTGMAAAVLYAISFVLPLVWWSDPRYIVPAVAAMLPPAISCCSAGLAAVFAELVQGRERVEQALAFGASRREAGQAVVKAGVRAALERLMQHMSGPGLLLLPALAAGLLLAGVPPMLAASYEVVFVLLVVACSALASVMAVTAATYKILSTDHRLRAGLLLPRADRRIGSVAWFQAEAEQAQLRIRSGWRKAAARVRVVMAHGAGRGRRDWLRRSFFRGRQRRGGEDTDDGASMSSRLREVVMGVSDEDAYSALSGGPADHDDMGAEPLPPASRGPPGRSLSGRLRMLPAALSMTTPARSWVGRWAANPFARARGDAPVAGGGLALYSEAPSAQLYLPPPPLHGESASAEQSSNGGPPVEGAPPHFRSPASHDTAAAAPAGADLDDTGTPAGTLTPLGRSPASDAAATDYYSMADRYSLGGSIADPMSPVRLLHSPYRP